MRRLEVADTSVLHVWNAPSTELELEQVGLMGSPHQHRLLLERRPLLILGEHALAHLYGLVRFISAVDELGHLAVAVIGPQTLGVGARRARGDLVRSPRENEQRRALVRDRFQLLLVQCFYERLGSETCRDLIEHMFLSYTPWAAALVSVNRYLVEQAALKVSQRGEQ
jgi:hypothetical protein